MKYIKGNIENGLTPITSSWMTHLFQNGPLLKDVLHEYGSPANIHHLDSFSENVTVFKEAIEHYEIAYQIYYARKANKCVSLVKRAFELGIGVDTASYKELEQCVQLGGTAKNVVLTSAIKTPNQIKLAIQHEIPIILDNLDEWNLTYKIASELQKKAKVGLRMSGFTVENEKLYSRFGFDIDMLVEDTISILVEEIYKDFIAIEGLHFHLDGYSTTQRGKALSDCLSLAEKLALRNIQIKFIDIGGGITMNYLESKEEWEAFTKNLQHAVLHHLPTGTFSNNGLGYENINGALEGKLNTYPFYNECNGIDFLRNVLDFKDAAGHSNAYKLKKQNIQFRLEPGRSLLNQVGITVAKVVHRKKDAKGQWLVGLDMNMSQMMSSSADFLLDPFVLYNENPSEEVAVYFTGAYCLERDVLLKRKITLPQLPQIDDIVVFVNTAGYMMHFFETEAHLFELSSNLNFTQTEGNPSLENFTKDVEI